MDRIDPVPHRAELPLRNWTGPPPQTPTNNSSSNNNNTHQPHRARRSSKLPRETTTEPTARGASDDHSGHDLSLNDQSVGASVVDTMLQSLNPDQTRAFRHLHSSSTNSDFNYPSDSSPETRTYQGARGRRSVSGSTFAPNAHHHSNSNTGESVENITPANAQRSRAGNNTQSTPRGHERGNGSNGSTGSASLDYGRMNSHFRAPPGLERRSASFDHGYRRRGLHSMNNSETHPPMPSSLSQPLFYNDIEAAPTPTVPGGPRKDSAGALPQIPAPEPSPAIQHRSSQKSFGQQFRRKSKSEALPWDNSVQPSNASRRDSRQMRSRNASPVKEPDYSGRFGRQDGSAPLSKGSAPPRPGFFRRVFGSSKPSSISAGTESFSNPSNQTAANVNLPAGDVDLNNNAQSWMPRPSGVENHARDSTPPPPLHKKPSSFFRRRKKSVTEPNRPPLIPLNVQANSTTAPADTAQRSPVSSLRKVMNPYLDQPGEKSQVSATGEGRTNVLKSKLKGQKTADPVALVKERSATGIKPSPPRDVPSQEQITAAQKEWNPDNYLERPPDTTFLHNFNSPSKRKDSSVASVDQEQQKSVDGAAAGPDEASKPVSALKEDQNRPTKTTTDNAKTESKAKSTPKHSRTSSKTFELQKPKKSAKEVSETSPPQETPAQKVEKETFRVQTPEKNVVTKDVSSVEPTQVSPASDYHSASSVVHPLKATGQDEVKFPAPSTVEPPAPKISIESLNDKNLPASPVEIAQAKSVFEGDGTIVSKETAAAWLGEPTPERARTRQAYMELFDWKDLNILAALRGLCGRLYLKGEAQQVDRLLDAFSVQWCACNPNHGFKAIDVVHTICYSLLLLNTDLHLAEIETKMTRPQFLKNILPTIRRVVMDAAPDSFTNNRASTLPSAKLWAETSASGIRRGLSATGLEGRKSSEGQRPTQTLLQRPSDQSTHTLTIPHTQIDTSSSAGDSGPLVKSGFHGKLSTWENQIEIILKDFYNAVRLQPLPLHGSEVKEPATPSTPHTTSNLSAMNSMLRRTPSMLSKNSESISYTRGRQADGRMTTGRWQSKTRSRPRLYPASTVASSRRSSFDEQSSVTSPSVVSTWSRFSSFGRTQTSFSVESFGSHFPPPQYQQSIGFANALSQAIIREEHPTAGDDESLRAAPLLEDESLELAGAPWAKEGILKHKHHLEAVDKKAKDRSWAESFAVIEKGRMRLFSFSSSAKSLRQKAKGQKFGGSGGPVGGGNWADNAELLGSFALRHTIASALPPPGYSKARPHVWALSLPTGAVHLFQVGTPEIVKEFVTTANYWSARLSKEPLVGAISNIEYGWGDTVINMALLTSNHTENTPLAPPPFSSAAARPSLQSSIRSARSSSEGVTAMRPKLPGDKIIITDWTPPQQSMVASALLEIDQLKQLTTYVAKVESELQRHNELRGPMLLAFNPRGNNHVKAMNNWERKSAYLLREIVKFRTYIDCLNAAQTVKEMIMKEREDAQDDAERSEMEKSAAVEDTSEQKDVDTPLQTTAKHDVDMEGKEPALGQVNVVVS